MNRITLQTATRIKHYPRRRRIQAWVDAALSGRDDPAELVIRLVDEQESARLNECYRHKAGPTNVLSFPFEMPAVMTGNAPTFLGDLVICVPVLEQEAKRQNKIPEHHWAHIIIHGVLHLIGYDHVREEQAVVMENTEKAILRQFNIDDPYYSEAPLS